MIPRTPVFHAERHSMDDEPAPEQINVSVLASQAVARHTECLNAWLAAPMHERGHHSVRIAVAWKDVRKYGMSGEAATCASTLMRSHHKLKSRT